MAAEQGGINDIPAGIVHLDQRSRSVVIGKVGIVKLVPLQQDSTILKTAIAKMKLSAGLPTGDGKRKGSDKWHEGWFTIRIYASAQIHHASTLGQNPSSASDIGTDCVQGCLGAAQDI